MPIHTAIVSGLAALLMVGQATAPRTVTGTVLTSLRDPAIELTLPSSATYAGTDRWTLYGVADCEIHVFVEAAGRRVHRLYWIQFEAYLPNVSGQYNYSSPVNIDIGGRPFVVNAGLWATAERMRRPDSDRERVLKVITAAGYDLPKEWMSLRMVHVPDPERRKELMIIYAEDLEPTGLTQADLSHGGKAEAQWADLEKDLLERARSRMTAQGSQDLGKFQGRWVFETFNGDPAPAAPNEVSLVVSGSTYQQFFGNKVAEEGSIRADVTKTPNWFDLVIEKGGDAGRVQPGLVSVEGDVMVLSLALPGEARPASKEAAHLHMVARRVK